MNLLKKLQECSTIAQADPILLQLNAGPAVKKLVETAIILNNSTDPQQRSHAFSFMESAIKEMEDDEHKDKIHEEEKMGQHSHEDGLPTKPIGAEGEHSEPKVMSEEEKDYDDDKDHKIHEEELKNYNNGPREDGSEQSSDNTAPYPGEGTDSANGEKPMQDMDGTVNQWSETNGMPPGAGGGMPPGMGGAMMPGLAPDVAQEMGMGMPQLPPMDTNQMMRQMQYTVEKMMDNYHKSTVVPLKQRLQEQTHQHVNDTKRYNSILKQQKEAIKTLSQELQETKAYNGSMKLDIDSMRKNASATFRETEPALQHLTSFDSRGIPGIQPAPSQNQIKLSAARSEIEQMDKILNSKSSIYN